MEKNMERIETRIYRCNDCPLKSGRFCTDYRSGLSRLAYDPLDKPSPGSKRLYKEPRELLESIANCPFRLRKTTPKIQQDTNTANITTLVIV